MIFIAVGRPRSRDRERRSHTRSPSPYRRRSRSRSRSPDRRYRSSRRSRSRSRSYSRSPTRSHRRRSDRPRYDRRRSRSGSRSSPYSRRHEDDVTEEAELVTDMFIRTVAAEVRGHDAKYEASLKGREKHNPKFGFLINKHVSAFVMVAYRLGCCTLMFNLSIEDMHSIADSLSGKMASIRHSTTT